MRRFILDCLSWCVVALLWVGNAHAHKGSDAYLDVQQVASLSATIQPGEEALRNYSFVLSVAIKDLDLILPIDANADGQVTWGEVKLALPLVVSKLNQVAQIEAVQDRPRVTPATTGLNFSTCTLNWQFDSIERRSDGAYLQLVAQAQCPTTSTLAMRYTLLKDQDATHRLLVAGKIAEQDILTTAKPQQLSALVLATGGSTVATAAQLVPASSRWSALQDYAAMGMHHLLEGYDHLAFLLALVLPLRLRLGRTRSLAAQVGGPEVPEQGIDGGWVALIRTVTAFTLGHSITLVLATLGWLQASPLWVEPVIALSIAVTALLNLRPVAWLRKDVLALAFGLIHGFGFAGLLLEAGAPAGLLPWALVGFNVGVEAGQLLAVCAWVLLSQMLMVKPAYYRAVVRIGSVLLIILATWWFWERVS